MLAYSFFIAAFLVSSQASNLISKHFDIETKFDVDSAHESVTDAVGDIIKSFFIAKTSILDIVTSASDEDSRNIMADIISETLSQLDSRVSVSLDNIETVAHSDRKKVFNIFYIDCYAAFQKVFLHLHPDHFNFQGYYLIVLTENSESQYNDMKLMMEDLWSLYIVNVNIVHTAHSNHNVTLMMTFYPYTSFHCEKVIPVLRNTFVLDQGFLGDLPHYPNKLANLHGCHLSIATFETPPFVTIKKNESTNSDVVKGFDGVLIKVLSRRMNFTLDHKILDKTFWGIITSVGNATGAIEMILTRKVNFTAGYFTSTPLRNKLMSSTYAYYTSNLVWVTNPGRPLTSFQRFAKPFSRKIWGFMFLTFALGVLVIVVVKVKSRQTRNFIVGRNVNYPILNMVNIMFGGAMNVLPRRNFARSILGMFMLYTLVMRNAYTGSLYTFLQTAVKIQDVKDMNAMLGENFTFLVLEALKEFIDNFPTIAKRSIILNNSQFLQQGESLDVSDQKFALLASEDHVAYWNKKNYPDESFSVCPERVSGMNLVIYLQKQSCLTPEFSRQILNFNSIGLVKIFKQVFIDSNFIQTHQVVKEPNKFSMQHLKGIFLILVIGLGASTLCFLFEVLSAFFMKTFADRAGNAHSNS